MYPYTFVVITDSSDDILAKYRGKGNSNEVKGKDNVCQRESPRSGPPRDAISSYDIFEDAKKKLRLVLSNSEIHQLPESLTMVLIIFYFKFKIVDI